MTYSNFLITSVFPPPTGLPRWITRRVTPLLQDEGAIVTFEIECINAIKGSTEVIFKFSGGAAGTSGWAESWHTTISREVTAHGGTYTVLNPSTYSATLAGLIHLGPNFDGKVMSFSNRSRLNRRTDNSASTPTNPGIKQFFLQQQIPTGVAGSIQSGNGTPIQLLDISQTPVGTPTFSLVAVMANGDPAPATLLEGDSFFLELRTTNMVPGTSFWVYAANAGQNKFTGVFRDLLKAAVIQAGCIRLDVPVSQTYNGIHLEYTDAYVNTNPIRVPLTVAQQDVINDLRQVDFISKKLEDGDPNWATQVGAGVVTKQISLRAPTPSLWQIEAKTNGATITYKLVSPSGSSNSTVAMASTGSIPAGFAASLQTAADAKAGIAFSGGVFTSDTAWDGLLTWAVPHPAGGSGKHSLRLSNPTGSAPGGPSRVVVADACVYLAAPSLPSEPTFPRGVNLSGGEFDPSGTAYATNYRYPARPENQSSPQYYEIDYHIGKGEGIIRLPVLWKRIQPTVFGPLMPETFDGSWAGKGGTALDIFRIDDIIDRVTNHHGKILILDIHNYAREFGESISMNATTTTNLAFYDLWERLANRYANNPKVWFGIMNEPNGYQATDWEPYAQGCVNAIRARTSALNRILVPGSFYTGAHSWVSSGNAAAMVSFYDPAANFCFEVHQYFDSDSSGTKGTCSVNSGATANNRLKAATDWARTNGFKLFLGEFMGGNPLVPGQEQCSVEVPGMCQFMSTNIDVWLGWTAWGGGQRWGTTYIFRLDPADYDGDIDAPCFDMIEPFIA